MATRLQNPQWFCNKVFVLRCSSSTDMGQGHELLLLQLNFDEYLRHAHLGQNKKIKNYYALKQNLYSFALNY
jgi:hypothetical protein